MKLTDEVTRRIIHRLLNGDDYRIEVLNLINAEFLTYVMDFMKRIHSAKESAPDSDSWYEDALLDVALQKDEIAINSGLNMKTISNMFNSATKDIVIEAATQHFASLKELISTVDDAEPLLTGDLRVEWNGEDINFSFQELLFAINTMAVKRAAIRGGGWSTVGKRVEKPLMETLCRIYSVPEQNYAARIKSSRVLSDEDFVREIDFYLIGGESGTQEFKCEVKLMGKGNPESADAVIARDSKIFVADKLSDTNKRQLNSLGVHWVELRSSEGFKRFKDLLDHFLIPHGDLKKDLRNQVDAALNQIFGKSS